MPTSREWVTIGFLAALAVLLVVVPSSRRSLPDVLRTAVRYQIILPVLLTALWAAWIVSVGWLNGAWNSGLVTGTVFWFGTAGLVSMANAITEAPKHPLRFVRALRDPFGIAVLLAVYVGLVQLPLVIEVVLQLVLVPTVLLYTVAKTKSQDAAAARSLACLIFAITLALILYVTVSVFTSLGTFDWPATLRGVLLPVWLTVGMTPLLYVFSKYSAWQVQQTHKRVRLVGVMD